MGYVKKTWVNKPNTTTPILANDLNHMEQGIYDATYENGLNVSNQEDYSYRVNVLKSKNLFDANKVLNGQGIASGGTITSATDNGLFYIPVIAGKTYIFSFTDNGVSGNIVWGYTSQVPANGVSCSYNLMTNANANLNGATFTPTGTQKYLCIRLNITANNQYNAMSNIQCEEGSTVTSYEPYITPSINVDNEEIYNKGNIDKLLAFDDRIDDRTYSMFLNTSSSSSFGITIKGSIDRHAFLVMGVNNAMGSILSIITTSSNVTNVKNLGTVNLSASRSGSNISVSGMGTYTYVYVIGYDNFTLYR